MKSTTAVRPGCAEPRLLCPICHRSQVIFHSEAELPVGSKLEKVSIFLCPESHTFFVPCCSLEQASASSKVDPFAASSSGSSRNISDREGISAFDELQMLASHARKLRREAAQMQTQLAIERRKSQAALADYEQKIKKAAELSLQNAARSSTSGKRPLPIQ
jgi:hypothetical protein